jgi:N utilization substance protein B
MISRRSRSREVALQLLYQRDQNPLVARPAVEAFAKDRLKEAFAVTFCLSLYDGVVAHLAEIDRRVAAAAVNWSVRRMAVVDRNVLRLGAFEFLQTPETPPNVVFDEAIELAKRFGSAASPAFVNGVLDKLRQQVAPLPTGPA